jgi:glycosyltransferase involved in cell wall biosynthesis
MQAGPSPSRERTSAAEARRNTLTTPPSTSPVEVATFEARRRMRIAFLAETLGCPGYLGGISRYTYLLGLALSELGHEVHVYTMATPEESRRELGSDCPLRFHHVRPYRPSVFGYRTIYYRLRAPLAGYFFVNEWAVPLVRRLLEDARRRTIDIIESPETGGRVAIGTSLLARYVPVVGRLHSPSFVTARDHWAAGSPHMQQLERMESMFARRATALSAPSHAVADLVRQRFGVSGQIRVIGNPVRLPVIGQRDLRPAAPRRVAYVGRVESLKGFDTLVRALPRIVASVPDVAIDLVGPDHHGLFGSGVENGLRMWLSPEEARTVSRATLWHGLVPPARADEIRLHATCVVVPSTFESFSYTLTEAMALGRPVVASRAGAMPEIIQHGSNGLLFDVGAHEELARCVSEVLLDPAMADTLGTNARDHVASRYAPLVIAKQMAGFYAEACAAVRSGLG